MVKSEKKNIKTRKQREEEDGKEWEYIAVQLQMMVERRLEDFL